MINIVIIAHSEIANGFASCAEHILAGRTENLYILGVEKDDSPDKTYAKATQLLAKLDGNILILSDIFGATPCNIATRLIKPGRVELVAGLSLSMLIRAISYSNKSLDVCVAKTLEGGQNGIVKVTGG